MKTTEKILMGTEAMNLRKKIFWAIFFQVFIIVVAFLTIAWLFFSEVSTEGTFWSALTRENISKFISFLFVILITYFVCGKYLSSKIRDLKYDLSIYLAKPQRTRNASSY